MATTSTSGITSGADQQLNYLNLLITQLQNQNPLDPMDSSAMTTQLAQISQVSQMENLNSTFSDVLQVTEMKYGTSLMGKQVSFLPDGQSSAVTGIVTGVETVNNEVHVRVGANSVDVRKVLSVSDASA